MDNNCFPQALIRFHIRHDLDHVWVILTRVCKRKYSHAGSGLSYLGRCAYDRLFLHLVGGLGFLRGVTSCLQFSLFHKAKNLPKFFWLIHACQLHYLLNYAVTTVSTEISMDSEY